jgi:hypothetical protein
MKMSASVITLLIGLNLFCQNKANPIKVNGYTVTVMIPDFESADSVQEYTLKMSRHELAGLEFKKSDGDTNTYWISCEIEEGLTRTDTVLMECTSGFMGWDYRPQFKYMSVNNPRYAIKTGVYLFTFQTKGKVRKYRLKAKMKEPKEYRDSF